MMIFFLLKQCTHDDHKKKKKSQMRTFEVSFSLFLQELIQYLKHHCPSHLYATSISTPSAQQIISAIQVILGDDGSNRGISRVSYHFFLSCLPKLHFQLEQLQCLKPENLFKGAQKLARIRENSNYFRTELRNMGFKVLGDEDSPVMPIMLYNPAKIPAFSRECLRENVSFLLFFCFHIYKRESKLLRKYESL